MEYLARIYCANSSVDLAGRSYSLSMGLVRDIVFYRMTILTSDGVIFVHAKVSLVMCVMQPGDVIFFFAPGRPEKKKKKAVVWLPFACMGGCMFRNWLGDHLTIVFDIPRHVYIHV